MTKIMLVEDDKSLREIYGIRLVAEGYQIVSAGDGEEALAMAIKEKPDLIISDVMMPKISGFDMLDILRSTPETKDMKVIMMTALSSEDQRARGEALGANKYLVKSQVGIEDVVRAVHEVLGDMPNTANKPSVFATPVPSQTINTTPAPQTPPVLQPTTTTAPAAPNTPLTAASTPTTVNNAPIAPTVPPVLVNPIPESSPGATTPTASRVAPPSQMEPTPMVSANPVSQVVNRTSSPLHFMATPPVAQKTAKQAAVPPSIKPPVSPITPPSYAANSQLPQPTAPFSSSPPASLGENFAKAETSQPDISQLMDQELNKTSEQVPVTNTQPAPEVPSSTPVQMPNTQPKTATPPISASPVASPVVNPINTPSTAPTPPTAPTINQ